MSVEKLMGAIKQASMGAMEAGAPVSVRMGIVRTVSPLSVTVDQRFTLTAEFLIVPESLTSYDIELRHTHPYTDTSDSGTATKATDPALPETPVVIRRGLEPDDKVILLRMQGGQQYIVLDRVMQT